MVSCSGTGTAGAVSAAGGSGSIVVYFSRADENYGVGYIDEGNTSIIAKMVAEKTGADMFEIVPEKAYPEGYDECCDVALAEQNDGARPAYQGDTDISSYKTVYLGYPIWWGDLPMCVYTFLENHDWAGKEIRPFCTDAGSGISGTEESIQGACSGAAVGEGLAIKGTVAQNSREEARSAVESWLG
jgi:flavodoxin